MIHRLTGALFCLALVLTGCGFQKTQPVELRVMLTVTTQESFKDTYPLKIRFGHESTGDDKPSRFIDKSAGRGWSGPFDFPRSGVLTATACLRPDLFGFVDVHTSEGSEVHKEIELVKAREAELNVHTPANGAYVIKEFGLSEGPEFSLAIEGKQLNIIAICSLNMSHFPNYDFLFDFELSDGKLVISSDITTRSTFEIKLEDSQVSETLVTAMGLVEIDGERIGFTATTPMQVISD